MKETKRIAIVPGSFDPITLGHVDIVQRAAERYDKVYLAVMINPEKNYMFSLEQRTKIAAAAVADLPNVSIISSEGMLWELAKKLGASAIVKGIRNEIDLVYEKGMAEYNSAHYSAAETIFLMAKEEYLHISSTAVRSKILSRSDLSEYLPPSVISEIQKILPSSF